MEQKKLFLLDAYALIFRAYHAMKYSPRFTSGGMNTSAIFGFVNTLEEVLRKENPTHIAVCFDPAGKTFRHEMFADYKAGREATPEDIKVAVPYIKDIIRAYGIPVVEKEGYEADDVIGTLATMSRSRGFSTFIMSPDKDLCQLVDPSVKIYRPGYKGQPAEVRGEKEVCDVFDINRPIQVIDILALMGDKVDNIVGCPGVGEKTASKLILEFDSVENLIANTDKLKGGACANRAYLQNDHRNRCQHRRACRQGVVAENNRNPHGLHRAKRHGGCSCRHRCGTESRRGFLS